MTRTPELTAGSWADKHMNNKQPTVDDVSQFFSDHLGKKSLDALRDNLVAAAEGESHPMALEMLLARVHDDVYDGVVRVLVHSIGSILEVAGGEAHVADLQTLDYDVLGGEQQRRVSVTASTVELEQSPG